VISGGEGVGAEAETLTSACRQGDHIFHGASQLYAEYVVAGVEPKARGSEFFLEFAGERRVLRSENAAVGSPRALRPAKGWAERTATARGNLGETVCLMTSLMCR